MQRYRIFLWNILSVFACICVSASQRVHVWVCACVRVCYSTGEETDSAAEGFWRSFPCRLFHLLPEPKLWSNIIQTWCIIDDFLEWPPKEQNINECLWLEEGRMFSIFKDIIIPHFSFFSCIPSLSVLKARSHSKWYFFPMLTMMLMSEWVICLGACYSLGRSSFCAFDIRF